MNVRKLVLPVLSIALTVSSASFAAPSAYINQIGYRVSDYKELTLFEGAGGDVEFVDASGATVLKVTPAAPSMWDAFSKNVQLVDFTELKTPGTYSIKVGGTVVRNDLKISDKAFEEVMKGSLKFFYYQRASMALEEQYAGKWKRAAGHLDTQVGFHSSAGGTGTIDSPKGWYDAGDYGKYIVNSGISTYTLLALYEHFPEFFKTQKWNIPADGALPDLLAEIKYNLDWMLTMQAEDGSVYHKLTSLKFCDAVQPAEDPLERFIIGKSATATLDFAGVMAAASRVYAAFDEAFANKCLEAAKKAYTWGAANTNVLYKSNPMGVETGAYNDGNASDELDFAAAELFFTTKDAAYSRPGASRNIPGWAEMGGLVTYEKAIRADVFGAEGAAAKDTLLKTADDFVETAMSGFGVPMSEGYFYWGSNSVAANQGIWLLHAYYVSGDEKYYKAALKALDYLLGKNPLDMSFVTGFGTKSPKHPHHRPSQSDGIDEPVPGMLVGGPQPGGEDIGKNEWECKDYRNGEASMAYFDDECSYASNEVAINWNSPLAYLAGAIEALNQGFTPSFANSSIHRGESVAIRGIAKVRASDAKQSMLRFKDQMLYVEKNGVRYNLKGHVIK